MSQEPKNDRVAKILLYGEILMRKAREEATPEDISQMDLIRKDLGLTESQAVEELEHIVKNSY